MWSVKLGEKAIFDVHAVILVTLEIQALTSPECPCVEAVRETESALNTDMPQKKRAC